MVVHPKKNNQRFGGFVLYDPMFEGEKKVKFGMGLLFQGVLLLRNSIGGNSLGNASEHHGLPLPACTKEAFSKKKITYRQSFGLLQNYPSIFKRAIDRNPISTLQFIDIKIAGSCGHFLPIHIKNYLFFGALFKIVTYQNYN